MPHRPTPLIRALTLLLLSLAGSTRPLWAQSSRVDSPGAVVRRLYNCFNRHNIDGCVALYADTVVILPADDTIARRMSRPVIRETVGKFLADNPRARVEVRLSVVGPFVTARERLINFPDGKTKNGLDVFDVHDGKIVAIWEFPELPLAPTSAPHW